MKLNEQAEEALEKMGIGFIEKGESLWSLADFKNVEAIRELTRSGYVTFSNDQISLSRKGEAEARGAVRRHRLAERLLADVLDVKRGILNEVSCRFEHLLHKGVEDEVCILLGHPRVCPHGKTIPLGKCCREYRKKAGKLVASLAELNPGEKGSIAYIHTSGEGELQKLLAMGAVPGSPVHLLQKFPSYVFKIGNSQFAVDKKIAGNIYVRLIKT